MRWPFVTRKMHEQVVGAKDARITELERANNRLIASSARQSVVSAAYDEMKKHQRKLRIAK